MQTCEPDRKNMTVVVWIELMAVEVGGSQGKSSDISSYSERRTARRIAYF